MPETIKGFAEHLIKCGMATPETIRPCSPAEVEEVRRAQSVDQLPPQYIEFLHTMGKQAGVLLQGTDFFYPSILDVADMRALLVENNVAHLLPPGTVLLGMHQGYQLYWLEPGNPSGPTYFYSELESSPRQSWPTLLDFLTAQAEKERQARERTKAMRKTRETDVPNGT